MPKEVFINGESVRLPTREEINDAFKKQAEIWGKFVRKPFFSLARWRAERDKALVLLLNPRVFIPFNPDDLSDQEYLKENCHEYDFEHEMQHIAAMKKAAKQLNLPKPIFEIRVVLAASNKEPPQPKYGNSYVVITNEHLLIKDRKTAIRFHELNLRLMEGDLSPGDLLF